jgi:hypothetical protein
VTDTQKLLDWQVPTFESDAARRQDWVIEQIQEGENWLESQNISSSEANLGLLSAGGTERLKSNSLKSDIRKFVETISDIREIATYGSGADQFKSIVDMFNRVVKVVYQKSHFPRQSRQALQYSVALKRGYLWPRYIRNEFGWGSGDIEFVALGPREVLPAQVPTSNDIQGAYAVTIVEPMGVAEAHARFPTQQDKLIPISRFKYTSPNQVRRHEYWDRRYGNEKQDWEQRYCEIRHTFIRDLRINRTGKMLQMGDWNKGDDGVPYPAASWSYEVPSVGSIMSWTDPNNGLPASRAATAEDCRIYPNLRQIITNPGMNQPLYDGPAFDLHGMMPPVQYDVDDWPWMAIGFSLLDDVASVERGSRAFLDLMYRVLRAKMNPLKGYDLNAGVPREELKRLDWLEENGNTIGVDGDPRKALQSLLPESVNVNAEDFKMYELLDKLRQKTLGLNDLGSLAQLKFNLSSETADKLLETIGPIAKGIAGNLEVAHSKIAEMLKYMILQYFSTRKLLSYIGPDGVSTEVFDFDPNSIVPSHLPWEKDQKKPSEVSRLERVKWFGKNLTTISVPSFLLNVTQMQEQMKWLNFLQRGMPVSYSTAMKKLGVDNWGDTPGDTEFEKYKHEQFDMINLKAQAAQVAQVDGLGGGDDKGKGKGKGGGRPPSGKKPPKLEKRGQTSGNQRTVVSQSE